MDAAGSTRSIDNDEFFGGPPLDERGYPIPAWRRAYVPEKAFFPYPRPPAERSFAELGARRTLVFGALLLGVGWLGILIQRGLLRQLVVGAPVFEEFAKFGLALVAVSLLRVRPIWARAPFGWASGAAFGVMEHFVTYADEDPAGFVLRVVFHAGSCGLAMCVFTLLEPAPDVRLRWASTLPSSLFHWAFNFGETVLAIALGLLGVPESSMNAVALGLGVLVAAAILVLTGSILVRPADARLAAQRQAARLLSSRASLNGAALGSEAPAQAALPEAAAEPGPRDTGTQEPQPQEPEEPRRPPEP